MKSLLHKTAVVTGGGVGRGIALGLSAHGMNVGVADLGLEPALRVKNDIAGQGGQALAIQVGSTSDQSLPRLVNQAVEAITQNLPLVSNKASELKPAVRSEYAGLFGSQEFAFND